MGRAAPIFIADQFALDEGFRDTLTHLKSSRSGFRRGNLVFDFYQPLSCRECSVPYCDEKYHLRTLFALPFLEVLIDFLQWGMV